MTVAALSREEMASIAARFSSVRIWVLGDVMLDRYFWGTVDRISPEAPVPVVKVRQRSARLGGAANVAANLRALGVSVGLLGVVGDDAASRELKDLLGRCGIEQNLLAEDPERNTTEKVRIIAQNQQIVRADFEAETPISDALKEAFFLALSSGAEDADALIVSDYGKGVVREDYLREAIGVWKGKGKLVLVDPNVGHFTWYRGASVVTPNAKEAASFYGVTLNGEASLAQIGFKMREDLVLDALLITRGEDGMSLFLGENEIVDIPTTAKEVYDVTGAGDTVVSVLAACLSAGAKLLEAVLIANKAAGEIVKEVGTSAVTCETLITSFE